MLHDIIVLVCLAMHVATYLMYMYVHNTINFDNPTYIELEHAQSKEHIVNDANPSMMNLQYFFMHILL